MLGLRTRRCDFIVASISWSTVAWPPGQTQAIRDVRGHHPTASWVTVWVPEPFEGGGTGPERVPAYGYPLSRRRR
ncbi:hypothetical protein P154DRAFT_526087 [Amniculicola lignicola CBS 123094]|uniref:Uncharacterized protein n=1 Tax=Amniculicola lignicola CBS 123094 TaxID=1392246 RepID=A0A6A5W4J7_9PLEO|nr:hypothetical protein P154DRAFT_526087 [Amniculicola lignicola CBS 123094]